MVRLNEVRIALIGFGNVGQGLANVLIKKRESLKQNDINIKVVGVADSKGVMFDENGIELEEALRLKKTKGTVAHNGMDVFDMIDQMGEGEIVVDMTPTNIETGEPGMGIMRVALDRGMHVVTSNKGPLALNFQKL